jgi:hypothetical protein
MATTRIASGMTSPGLGWQQYPGGAGVFIDVDTGSGKFSTTPAYVTSLGGGSSHWATTGGTSVYLPTPTGFRIYVRWADGSPLSPANAATFGWHVKWIGMEV